MLKRAFMLLYRSRLGVSTALARMDAELGSDPYVREMIDFIRGGQKRGISRCTKERDDERHRLTRPRRELAHRGRGHPGAGAGQDGGCPRASAGTHHPRPGKDL